jgi:hypothetical protein
MDFRLIVSEAPDLTAIHVVGRLRDAGVGLLDHTCAVSRRPIVLDLSELSGASETGVLLLNRLAVEGVHLLGASPYVRLLLTHGGSPQKPSMIRSRRLSPASRPKPTRAGSRPRPRS